MSRPKRVEPIDLAKRIRAAAWKQMADAGASSFSLRGIARELSITAPAIYNYYASRDELVTALIQEAVASLGENQRTARDGHPANDFAGGLRTTGTAYRAWALAKPERYRLIFGTPIPGYQAPLEQIQPVAASSLFPLVGLLEAARRAGKLRLRSVPPATKEQREKFRAGLTAAGKEVDLRAFAAAVLIWGRVHGLVSLEIGRQLPEFGPAPADLFAKEIENLIAQFIER